MTARSGASRGAVEKQQEGVCLQVSTDGTGIRAGWAKWTLGHCDQSKPGDLNQGTGPGPGHRKGVVMRPTGGPGASQYQHGCQAWGWDCN